MSTIDNHRTDAGTLHPRSGSTKAETRPFSPAGKDVDLCAFFPEVDHYRVNILRGTQVCVEGYRSAEEYKTAFGPLGASLEHSPTVRRYSPRYAGKILDLQYSHPVDIGSQCLVESDGAVHQTARTTVEALEAKALTFAVPLEDGPLTAGDHLQGLEKQFPASELTLKSGTALETEISLDSYRLAALGDSSHGHEHSARMAPRWPERRRK